MHVRPVEPPEGIHRPTMWDTLARWKELDYDTDWIDMMELAHDDIAALQYMYSNPNPKSHQSLDDFPLRVPTIFQSFEEAEDFKKGLPFQPPILMNYNTDLIDPDSTNKTPSQ